MFNKKNFIILVIIINMIISVCISMNVFAAANLAIYTSAAPTTDSSGNIWVYFGTGDKTDPSSTNCWSVKEFMLLKIVTEHQLIRSANLMDISSVSI